MAIQQKILTAVSVVFARRPDVMELELPLVVGEVAKELRGWRDVPLHVVSGLVMGLGTREGYRVTSNSTGSRGWVIRLPTPQELISMLAKDRGFFQTVVGADLHLHVVSTFGKAGFKGFAELVKKLADEDGDDQELDKEPLVDEYIRSMAEAVAERVARMENTGPKVTSVMLAIPPPSTASTAPADSTASRVASLMAPVLSNLLDKRPVIVSRAYRRQPLPSSSHALSGRKHMDRKCQMLAEGLQHVVPFEIDPEAGQALFLVDDSVESGATAAAFIVACRMRLGADLEVDFWGPARFGGTAAVSLGYEALDRGARVHLPGGFSALLRGLEGQGLSPAAGQLMKEIDDGFRRVQQADPDHRQVSRYVVGKRMVAELLASIPSVARFLGLLREEPPPSQWREWWADMRERGRDASSQRGPLLYLSSQIVMGKEAVICYGRALLERVKDYVHDWMVPFRRLLSELEASPDVSGGTTDALRWHEMLRLGVTTRRFGTRRRDFFKQGPEAAERAFQADRVRGRCTSITPASAAAMLVAEKEHKGSTASCAVVMISPADLLDHPLLQDLKHQLTPRVRRLIIADMEHALTVASGLVAFASPKATAISLGGATEGRGGPLAGAIGGKHGEGQVVGVWTTGGETLHGLGEGEPRCR